MCIRDSKHGELSIHFVVSIPDLTINGLKNEFTQPGDTTVITGENFDLYGITIEEAIVNLEMCIRDRDIPEWTRWVEWLESKKISWVNWSISDKNETCSMIFPRANKNGGWDESLIKPAGRQSRKVIRQYNSHTVSYTHLDVYKRQQRYRESDSIYSPTVDMPVLLSAGR